MPDALKESSGKLRAEDVIHISELCRIKLSEDEIDLFTTQFNDILAFFSELDDIDTSDIPPMFHVIDLMNIFREDKVEPSLSREDIFKNIPKKEGKFIRAPRMT